MRPRCWAQARHRYNRKEEVKVVSIPLQEEAAAAVVVTGVEGEEAEELAAVGQMSVRLWDLVSRTSSILGIFQAL